MKSVIAYVAIIVVIGAAIFFISRNSASNTDNNYSIENTVPPPAISEPVPNQTEPNPTPSNNSMNKTAELHTNKGVITLELFAGEAPKTVENFVKLANAGFYNGTKFHRVIKDFMIQGGDPNSKDDDWSDDGTGGPGYKFADEFNNHKIVKGTLAMANSGPNTNGSQFFIVTAEATPWLDGKHTAFGMVTSGMDVVLAIEGAPKNANDHPTQDMVVEKVVIK